MDSTGKGGGNLHIENSLSFPLHFRREIMWKLEFPHKSAWKFGGRGWLARWVWDLDCKYNSVSFGTKVELGL